MQKGVLTKKKASNYVRENFSRSVVVNPSLIYDTDNELIRDLQKQSFFFSLREKAIFFAAKYKGEKEIDCDDDVWMTVIFAFSLYSGSLKGSAMN